MLNFCHHKFKYFYLDYLMLVYFQDLRVFYREVIPVSSATNRLHPRRHQSYQVLLLHGKSYTSQNWEDIGTLSILAGLGHRAVALDLPGYGKSEKDATKKMNASLFLMEVIEKLDLRNSLVIVSPSMSGTYSLPFLVDHPERVKGYVPVAPVETEKYISKFSKIFVSIHNFFGIILCMLN